MAYPRSVLTDPILGSIHAAMTHGENDVPVFQTSLRVMGTTAHITTVGGSPELPETLRVFLRKLDGLWSRFRNDSEISRLNNAPDQSVRVSPETLRLFQEMSWGFSRTAGAFDPTILPALMAEGYTSSLVTPGWETHIPKSSRARGSFTDIDVQGSTITLPAGTTVDSGGVGKGLAADMAIELAMSQGALGALVEVGGDLRVEGVSPRSDQWRLAIENPLDPSQRLTVVELSSQGLATSTITKRRFMVGERETHHIIDPRTARSALSDTVQASVIAGTASQAEMWTKVAFVSGSSQLLTQGAKHGFHAACLVQDGRWVTSSGWPRSDA